MDAMFKEAIRYLGYSANTVDGRILRLIGRAFDELEKVTKKKHVCHVFGIAPGGGDLITIGPLRIRSRDLKRNLNGCAKAVLFAATLGTDADRLIRMYEAVDMTAAVVTQACATAMLEDYCDKTLDELLEKNPAVGSFKPRFSPGYGDFSILYQRDILKILDTQKMIGLAMTDGYMLTPTKSVTAVIGEEDGRLRETKAGA